MRGLALLLLLAVPAQAQVMRQNGGGGGGGDVSAGDLVGAIGELATTYVNITGDNMTGPLTMDASSFTVRNSTLVVEGAQSYVLDASDQHIIDAQTNPHTADRGALEILFTAGRDDISAIDLVIDDSTFDSIKGIEIDHTMTDLTSEEVDVSLDMQLIFPSGVTGGTAAGLLITAAGVGTPDRIAGYTAGPRVFPIVHDSGELSDATTAFVYTDSDTTYADRTTEFGSTGSDITMFVSDDDQILIGALTQFAEIEFDLATVSSKNLLLTFEHSDDLDTWTVFNPIDNTDGMTQTGVIVWDVEEIVSWTTATVSGTGITHPANNQYWIRITRTRNGSLTSPIEDLVQVSDIVEYHWDNFGGIFSKTLTVTSGTFTQTDADLPGVTISSGLVVSTGSFGIGTETPVTALEVYGHQSDQNVDHLGAWIEPTMEIHGNGARFLMDDTGAGDGFLLLAQDGAGGVDFVYNTNEILQFMTCAIDGTGCVVRMTMDGSSQFSIGATAAGTDVNFYISQSEADDVMMRIENTNTGSAANSKIDLFVAGTAGDPFIRYTGVAVLSWYAGMDNSRNNDFVIGSGGNNPGAGTDHLRLGSGGDVTILAGLHVDSVTIQGTGIEFADGSVQTEAPACKLIASSATTVAMTTFTISGLAITSDTLKVHLRWNNVNGAGTTKLYAVYNEDDLFTNYVNVFLYDAGSGTASQLTNDPEWQSSPANISQTIFGNIARNSKGEISSNNISVGYASTSNIYWLGYNHATKDGHAQINTISFWTDNANAMGPGSSVDLWQCRSGDIFE